VPGIVEQIAEIMSQHPERGPFEVAIGRSSGADRAQRIFLEMARWSDDVRGGEQDHPTWHGAFRPIVDLRDPPPKTPPDAILYEAFEALALNVRMAADPRAPASERAVALCWVFHIVGDIHQPLHAAELYFAQFPDGDRYGSSEYRLDPKTGRPVNLHFFWDDLVHQEAEPEMAMVRAHQLEKRLPARCLRPNCPKTGSCQPR
jgi:hypothetical protein